MSDDGKKDGLSKNKTGSELRGGVCMCSDSCYEKKNERSNLRQKGRQMAVIK